MVRLSSAAQPAARPPNTRRAVLTCGEDRTAHLLNETSLMGLECPPSTAI